MAEFDLLKRYPRAQRDPKARAAAKTPDDIRIAREFGYDFFDGDRRHGYGGYRYSPTRWAGVVEDLIEHYAPFDSVLDVGCAKGYMLQELRKQLPACRISGIDVSQYAIRNAPEEIRQFLWVRSADDRCFPEKYFDLVVSINTVHNLPRPGCIAALQEIERTGKQAYVTVDAYRTEEERKRMLDWNLTALTILHVDEWLELFKEAGYTGDWGFWGP